MSFQFKSINENQFSHFYGLSDDKLKAHNVIPYIATSKPGYPCRVTLKDAEPGERLLLINYVHLNTSSPYHASHAIFVKEGAKAASCEVNEIPEIVANRLLSIRAFDNQHMMLDATVCEGKDVVSHINQLFSHTNITLLQIHTAKRGCFLTEVVRSDNLDK